MTGQSRVICGGLAFVPAGSRLPSWSWWIGVVVSSWKGWRHNSNERKVVVMPLCPSIHPRLSAIFLQAMRCQHCWSGLPGRTLVTWILLDRITLGQ